jgi:hypothetical protein
MTSHLPILLPSRTLSYFIANHQPIQTTNSSRTSSITLVESTSSSLQNKTAYPSFHLEQIINMPARRNNATVTRTTKPTLMTRLKGRNANSRTVKTTETIVPGTTRTTRSSRFGSRRNEPVVHHKRHATIGDKISGAMMKLKGSLTRRPGVKVCWLRLHDDDVVDWPYVGRRNTKNARHWRKGKPSCLLKKHWME